MGSDRPARGRAMGCDGDGAPWIAETAIVEEGVSLGPRVRVWHHAQVRVGASVGEGVVLGKGCFVDEGVVIGRGSKVQNGAQLYAPAVLEDGVFVGPMVVLTNDRFPRAMGPQGVEMGKADWRAIGCQIGCGASLGAGSMIVCTTVGAWAMVGAGSVVTKPVPSHALVFGVPARQVGWVCRCGVRQRASCPTCGWTAA